MPQVSIIMPVLNSEKYLQLSIKSILDQTFKDWELIIVDDGSQDKSLEIINTMKTNQFIVLQNNKTLGAAKSRNYAIHQAKGRYIAFIDSDDIWKKEKLEVQLQYMKNENIAFSFSSYERINEKNEKIGRVEAPLTCSFKDLLKSTPIQISTVILDREMIPEELIQFQDWKTCEDIAMYLQILNTGIVARGIPKYLSQYKARRHSLSSNKLLNTIRRCKIYKQYPISWKDRYINIVKHIKNSILRSIS